MKKNIQLVVLIVAIISFTSCRTYKKMTTKPKEYVLKPSWDNPESEIKFSVSQSMEPLKEELRKIENERYESEVSEDIKPVEFVVKTKNPLYNPIKWIKTKNPLYNPKKWIKICGFWGCVKTKNPAYNPVKWIKTKNPAYSPNKYTSIATSISTVQGYKIDAWVDGKITLTPYEGNKFNIQVPIKTRGWVTLITGFTPPIVRKPFEGKIVVDLDLEIGIDNKWCVKVKPNANFKWIDRLKLDLTYGLKLLQVDLTDLANPEIKKLLKDIEKDISESFNCEEFKSQAEKEWRTRAFQIDEKFWAIAVPKEISLSQIQANDETINLFGGIKTEIRITDNVTNLPNAGELPDLNIIEPVKPSIDLSLPVEVPYNYIDSELSKTFSNIEIGDEGSSIRGKLLVKEIKTFPSGKQIGLKVKFKTDLNLGLLNVKATAYFTGKLKHKTIEQDNRQGQVLQSSKHYIAYELDSLAFNDFGNGKHKILLTLAYKSIQKEIENMDDIDITSEVKKAEELLLKAIDELVLNLPQDVRRNYHNIELTKPIVKIGDWAYTKDHLIMLLNAKVNLK